ncbi:MAG TPA: hypothetical protein PKD58_12195 [Candidatus Sumerlaeota bacterium]|nr:hypothetical protein [Candidatus Sumerlaeota bacterium]HMZ52757.1 hypothetical protein [Candidatus Sumerlaeota bacterium]
MRTIALLLFSLLFAGACATHKPSVTPASFAGDPAIPPFNQLILAEAAKYPTDGTHTYWWPRKGEGPKYDGCSADVFLGGKKVMSGEPEGRTFCCGLTLEVFAKVYDEFLKQNPGFESPLTEKNWKDFQGKWFVREMQGDGPGDALEAYGLGEKIARGDVLPGDFVQLWRNKRETEKNPSGHSVIFLAWQYDQKGEINGLRYWSTQTSTNGIHERIEEFGEKPGNIDAAHTYYSRANPKAGLKQNAKSAGQ